MTQSLLDEVRVLVNLQSALLSALVAQIPAVKEDRWLIGCASSGRVETQDGTWMFAKHGAGYRFTRQERPQLVVDIHKHLDAPNLVDSWRLQQFLESKGCEFDLPELRTGLEQLCAEGHVMKDGLDQYRVDLAKTSQKG